LLSLLHPSGRRRRFLPRLSLLRPSGFLSPLFLRTVIIVGRHHFRADAIPPATNKLEKIRNVLPYSRILHFTDTEYNTFVDILPRSVSVCKQSTALRVDALGAKSLHSFVAPSAYG
jgi:hypothetical protein